MLYTHIPLKTKFFLWRHTMKSVMMNASQKLAKKNRINCLQKKDLYCDFFVEDMTSMARSIRARKLASSLRKK